MRKVEDGKEYDEAVFQTAAAFYATWIEKAEQESDWAEEHPASVEVKRDRNNHVYLETEPELEKITGVRTDLYVSTA